MNILVELREIAFRDKILRYITNAMIRSNTHIITCIANAVATLSLVIPMSALALNIQADDSVAGLGTDIDISQATPGDVFTVVITPPLGSEVFTNVTITNVGTAHVFVPGAETEVAGMYTVQLETNGKATEYSTEFEILADSTHESSSTLTSDTSYIAADGSDSAKVTVILRDRYGNPLANRPVKLISSRTEDMVENLTFETNQTGEQQFMVRTQKAGAISLRAIDFISGNILTSELIIDAGSNEQNLAIGGNDNLYSGFSNRPLYRPGSSTTNFGANLQAQVGYGPVAGFVIAAPRTLKVNEDATIRITAVDAEGNRVEDYTGTILLSSTDPNALLPIINGQVPMRVQDTGSKQLVLGTRFRTAGEHELHAVDSTNSSVGGYTTITVTGGSGPNGATKLIQVDEPKDNAILNETSVTITGTTEPFVNLIATGGIEEVLSETDINGEFRIQVELDPEIAEHTLRVQDDSGLLDSGNIDVVFDATPPDILSVTVSPENPTEGTDALIVIETDDTVAAFAAKLDNKELEMNTTPSKPNTYQALIEAPKAGSHEITITIVDEAQNEVTETSIFRTALKGLPKVTGVEATTKDDVIDLQWDAVTAEKVDAYRIYVGQTATEFEFSLDSNQATTAAQIAGLQPGVDYYFAVTALKGERESDEKSEVAKATVYGMNLNTQAQNNSIQLDWSNMQTNIPLSSFILEYGVEPGAFTEKRILNGELRNYTIRDLINEVHYFIQLTPVSLTGELVETMVATAEDKPVKVAGGFRPSAAEPIPDNLAFNADLQPPPNLHGSAPETSSTGLPSSMWFVAAAMAFAGWYIQWKRKQQLQSTLSFMQAMDKRYQNQ